MNLCQERMSATPNLSSQDLKQQHPKLQQKSQPSLDSEVQLNQPNTLQEKEISLDKKRVQKFKEKRESNQIKVHKPKSIQEILETLQNNLIIKFVFGERSKMQSYLPLTLDELRYECAKQFKFISEEAEHQMLLQRQQVINPEQDQMEELSQEDHNYQFDLNKLNTRDQQLIESIRFIYQDPQGDKIELDSDLDLYNIYSFACLTQQKLVKIFVSSTCQDIQVFQVQTQQIMPLQPSPFRNIQQQTAAQTVQNASMLKRNGQSHLINNEQQNMMMSYLGQARQNQHILANNPDSQIVQMREPPSGYNSQAQSQLFISQQTTIQQNLNNQQHQQDNQMAQDLEQKQNQGQNQQSEMVQQLESGLQVEKQIVREGYRYNVNMKFKNFIYYKCEDSKTLKCKGIWKLDITQEAKDRHGALHKPHTISLENHDYFQKQIKTQAQTRQIKITELQPQIANELIDNINILLNENIETSLGTLVDQLKDMSSPALNQNIDKLQNVIQDKYQEIRKKIKLESQGLLDVKTVKTLRNTSFARYMSQRDFGCQVNKAIFFLSSDFMIRILKSNKDQDQHVYIDTQATLDQCQNWETTNQLMPLCMIVSQTQENAALEIMIEWFQKECGDFFKPKQFSLSCRDLEQTLQLKAIVGKIYPQVEINSTLFNKQKCLIDTIKKYQDIDEKDRLKLYFSFSVASLEDPKALNMLITKIKEQYADSNENMKQLIDELDEKFLQTNVNFWNLSRQIKSQRPQFFALQRGSEQYLSLYNDKQFCTWAPVSDKKSNIYQILDSLKLIEHHKFKEFTDSQEKCKNNKTMLHEYNFGSGLNPYYIRSTDKLLMSEWLERILHCGDVINDRLQDVILKEIEKTPDQYIQDSEVQSFQRYIQAFEFNAKSSLVVGLKKEEPIIQVQNSVQCLIKQTETQEQKINELDEGIKDDQADDFQEIPNQQQDNDQDQEEERSEDMDHRAQKEDDDRVELDAPDNYQQQ
eukprot:403377387